MTKTESIKIIEALDSLNNNILNPELINEAYSYLPNVNPDVFQRMKVQAIHRYVTFNLDVLNQVINTLDPIIEKHPEIQVKRTPGKPRSKTWTKHGVKTKKK